MPVNTAALKTFAPAMRRQLLEAVGRKLDQLLHSQTPDTLSTYAKQIAELREQEAENREQLLERVAYTWFNRLCALRYLDARGWHPFGCKVLMPAAEGETQPELLKLMLAGSLPAELKPHTNEARLHGLLDGQIPPAIAGADPQGEVYRELVLASCRSYHQLLPELFEGLDDASELLLPDDLLSEGSIAGGFRSAISDADCEDVEIIGWLYQFYISDKKDEVMGRKRAVAIDEVPSVTQLFTPHWIVRYLIENSLGRLWLRSFPQSKIRDFMPYYIEDAELGNEEYTLTVSSPEDIRLLDPACGSGHMLTYSFDLLSKIYEEAGYSQAEIPGKILSNNIVGLDICPRAIQLAQFSLLCKSREQSRGAFRENPVLRLICLNSSCFNVRDLAPMTREQASLLSQDEISAIARFSRELQIGGSLASSSMTSERIEKIRQDLRSQAPEESLFSESTRKLQACLEAAGVLSQKYHVVFANPPYLSSSGMSFELKEFARKKFDTAKQDLATCFVVKAHEMLYQHGFLAFVTLQGWISMSTFTSFREWFLGLNQIDVMTHIGFNSFPEMNTKLALAIAFVAERDQPHYKALFLDLDTDVPPSTDKEELFLQKRLDSCAPIDQRLFLNIKSTPIAISASEDMLAAFNSFQTFGELCGPKVGMQTSDNSRHVRFWWEINSSEIEASLSSHQPKWISYLKGGGIRKWYGNDIYLLNYGGDGRRILETPNATLMPLDRLSRPKCTWGSVSISFSCRLAPEKAFHDIGGHCLYPTVGDQLLALGCSNTKVFNRFLRIFSSTLNIQVGDVSRIPFPLEAVDSGPARSVASRLVNLMREDWDENETSKGFKASEVFAVDSPCSNSLLAAVDRRLIIRSLRAHEIASLESVNEKLWSEAYGVNQVIQVFNPDVSDNSQNLVLSFISYATGCMMGRYSLDRPGLILADSRNNQAEHLAAYEVKAGHPLSEVKFKPGPDGIIPVLDGEWFEDDIVARTREFLAVTFPESSVAENLRFIEESLGKDIRKYFCSEFYKDHLQTYKKRPIYWLVQSPKKGFACLIYLHRYTKDTLNQVLNNYFRPYLQKLEARLAQLGLDQLNDDLPARERTAARKEAEKITKVLKECQTWEQDALLPLAQQRIELDLDDGVKVNYIKLQDVLAPIPGLAAKED